MGRTRRTLKGESLEHFKKYGFTITLRNYVQNPDLEKPWTDDEIDEYVLEYNAKTGKKMKPYFPELEVMEVPYEPPEAAARRRERLRVHKARVAGIGKGKHALIEPDAEDLEIGRAHV